MVSFVFKNHYERLEISPEATEDEIRKAYRKLARTYHPDVAKDKLLAQDVFILISEAHRVLTDPEARQRYDLELERKERVNRSFETVRSKANSATGRTPYNGFAEAAKGTRQANWEFTQNHPGAQRASAFHWKNTVNNNRPRTRKRPDLDARANIEVPLEDALHGALHTVTVECTDPGQKSHRLATYHVKIPAAVYHGQEVRMGGCGLNDPDTGEKGDLYLKIHYASHKRFRLMGDHLFTEIEVPVWEVMLGGFIRVPTLEGDTSLQIPAGAQAGQRFTLNGQGMPHAQGGRGDLIFSLKVTFPTAETARQKELWRALAREYKSTR